MLHVCLAGILGLVMGPPAGEQVAHTLSTKAAAIEAKVVALSQQNEAMQAGKVAAQAMRAAELAPGDRYYLGSLAFDAYIVAHINEPSAAALCEARRVAQAMTKAAATATEKAAARGLVGQANSELARLQPPGQCGPRAARAAKSVPELLVAPPAVPVVTETIATATTTAADPSGAASAGSPPGNRGSASTSAAVAAKGASPERAPGDASPAVASEDAAPVHRARANEGSSSSGSRRLAGPVAPPRPEDPGRRWTPRAWAGLGTAVVGAGLVAGMAGGLRGRRLADDTIEGIDRAAEDANRELTMEEALRIQDANGRWHRLTTVAIVTGTAGAAALLTGVVLMATGVRRRVDVSPWGDRTSAGFWVTGRF